MRCGRCDNSGELRLTVYGELLCEDCWDDYVNSKQGRVEYFINIVKGKESLSAFDADFLGDVGSSWRRNRNLLTLSSEEIEKFEEIAFSLGII